jgi:hypothetical protein
VVHGKYHFLHFNLVDSVKLGDFFLNSSLLNIVSQYNVSNDNL